MNQPEPKCPDCKTAMVEGEVLYTPNGLAQYAVEWLEREPERSGLAALKPSSKHRRKLASYRCPECGLLREYAS
jgi:hypothetical protein